MSELITSPSQTDQGLASLQIIFNLFRQKPIPTLLPAIRERVRPVAVIVRHPMASGALGGRLTAETRFAADDHRSYNRDEAVFNVGETFAGLPFEEAADLADRLRALVPGGMTLAEMAQRRILDRPEVSTVITGASRPDQVRRNAAVADLVSLSPDLTAALSEFYVDHVRRHVRGPD